jgi:gamma-glutamyl:cysteine ligase YbdK (ATP-grasp superfamily)
MGRDIQPITISREDRRKYRDKVRRSLDAFARMLHERTFASGAPLVGQEIELNLVDASGAPSMRNADVLKAIANPAWATELGQFNLEINVPPRTLDGDEFADLEDELRSHLNAAEARARTTGCHLVMIGILPTLGEQDVDGVFMSANERYRVLNDQIFAARGEDMQIAIDGAEQLMTTCDSITPEAACTSVQLHLQVSPEEFASYWNAAQAIAAAQVALAANSPFLFTRQLWQETRLPLFEQATDTRPEELKAQGVRPRVWFGERWVTSVFDLFEENLKYFPALLPICEDEDPVAVLDSGGIPHLAEMSLHNGTIYRWNRPVYAVAEGIPHLRVENRVLPAGPTIADLMANAAFYYGLVRVLAEAQRPIWTQMSFTAATENLREAARDGMEARLYWPGLGEVPVAELVVRRLLPLAREGLARCGVADAHAGRLLGIIEQRCLTGQTGAAWQIATVAQLEDAGLSRQEALREMTLRYIGHMHTNDPVHTWPLTLLRSHVDAFAPRIVIAEDLPSSDVGHFRTRHDVERIPGPDDQVRVLADTERPESVRHPDDPRRVDRHRPQRLNRVQPLLDRQCGLVDQEVHRHHRMIGGDRDRHARRGQPPRVCQRPVAQFHL